MFKRYLRAGVMIALICGSAYVYAGDYHNSPIICSDCHAMHASISDGGTLFNAGAGYVNLLKAPNTAALCLRCHSQSGPDYAASGAPGVADYTGADSFAGGGFNLNNVTGVDAYTQTNGGANWTSTYGHDLEVVAEGSNPPGFDATDNWRDISITQYLTCTSCHDQHGDTETYRNLLRNPNTDNAEITGLIVSATYKGRTDAAVWQGTNSYNEDVSSFCQDCHEKFGPINTYGGATGQGNPGPYDNEGLVDNTTGANTHHPIDLDLTAGVQTNYNNATGGDTLPLLNTGATDSVMCLTCHRAHGSLYADATRWNNAVATLNGGPEGCQVCHDK